MQKAVTFFIILVIFLLGCKKNADKTEELPQVIANIIEQSEKECPTCGVTINRTVWKGEEVYTQTCNGAACLCARVGFSKTGDSLGFIPIDVAPGETIFICRNEP